MLVVYSVSTGTRRLATFSHAPLYYIASDVLVACMAADAGLMQIRQLAAIEQQGGGPKDLSFSPPPCCYEDFLRFMRGRNRLRPCRSFGLLQRRHESRCFHARSRYGPGWADPSRCLAR